jgi:hypothetical protein
MVRATIGPSSAVTTARASSPTSLVVPVPSVLERGQIRIGDRKLFEHIDSYSAPRLAEYFDPDPCRLPMSEALDAQVAGAPATRKASADKRRDQALGVTVEASYTVGEYDIVILSGKQSDGLETWLRENGYRVPKNAAVALLPLHQAANEILSRRSTWKSRHEPASRTLRPLQFAFESERFMLPVRLGMLNANGRAGPRAVSADGGRPCRDDQLPDRQDAREHELPGLRARRILPRLQAALRGAAAARITARCSPSISGT